MKQLTFFDLIPEEENKEADLCETCRYLVKGCCSYNEPLGRYCVLGDAYEFKPPEAPQFPESKFAEIVEYINKRLDVNFQKVDKIPDGDKEYYEYKPNKHIKLELSKSRFFPEINEGREYIGVGFQTTKDGFSGASAPLDSVEEAIQWFERYR